MRRGSTFTGVSIFPLLYPPPLQTQSLTSADTVDMRVMCHEGGRWRVLMTQKFKPFENRE